MTVDNGKRFFLKGNFSQSPPITLPRPPWTGDNDALFIEKCTRCSECIKICPTSVLKLGDGGFPEVSFQSNGCDLCGKCAEVCKPLAINKQPTRSAWTWLARIKSSCLAQKQVECRICGEFCEQKAIKFKAQLGGISIPEVNLSDCTGCGHCVSKCPTQAIHMA